LIGFSGRFSDGRTYDLAQFYAFTPAHVVVLTWQLPEGTAALNKQLIDEVAKSFVYTGAVAFPDEEFLGLTASQRNTAAWGGGAAGAILLLLFLWRRMTA
jgi:hypothetical protein